MDTLGASPLRASLDGVPFSPVLECSATVYSSIEGPRDSGAPWQSTNTLALPLNRFLGLLSLSGALIITSLSGGAGVTQASTLVGMASAKVQLIPLTKAADHLHLDVRMLSLDIDKPSILNRLGTPSVCFISKINHHKDARVGFCNGGFVCCIPFEGYWFKNSFIVLRQYRLSSLFSWAFIS